MKTIKKFIVMLIVTMAMMALSTMTTHAISLTYSGGSSSNDTGASATTSGFSISYSETNKNICGYRFSVVTSSGTPKSGTKVVNVFLSDITEGASAYSSAQRFIVSSGKIANKKQLANGTKVSGTTTKQSCDYESGSCGFYSTLPQSPSKIGSWIKASSNSYQNLQRIYVLCGTNLANATESDFVLIEPVFRLTLASKRTAATATELAVYGASVSGGDGYNGSNGNLYNAGSGTLWNLSNYVNREFPNTLYVSSDTSVYDAVTTSTSTKYTYKNIISKGYGCSVLTVKNVVTIKRVLIAYNPNGGTVDVEQSASNWIMMDDKISFHEIKHGASDDPYNASTFGLKKAGYTFGGWKVKSTGKILDEDTKYASTVYAQYDDSSKTTANTEDVRCRLYAVWIPNVVRVAYNPNGGTVDVEQSASNWIMMNDQISFHVIDHGASVDPYNAATFGLKKTGYTFAGWKVKSTGKILDEDTKYASTVYAQYDDSSITTANTNEVRCRLYAVWEKNTYTNSVVHWKYVGTGGDNANGTYKKMATDTFTGSYNSAVTIPSNLVKSYTGHYNTGVAGSTWGGSTWAQKNIGTTFTQPAKNISMEYYYLPKELTVVFNKNDGSGGKASQIFTYGVAGNRFGYNNDGTPKWGNNVGQFGNWDREGYTLLGWSHSSDATAKTHSTYSNVSDSWLNRQIPTADKAGTVQLYAVWQKNNNSKINIVSIEPNAGYRENTEVVSSFWLVNITDTDYTPTINAKVSFKVYNESNEEIAGETQNFVVPKADKNLAYFKWKVPINYANTTVTVRASIIEGSQEYGLIEDIYEIIPFNICKTPDTDYKGRAPEDFSVPSSPSDDTLNGRWWQWEYSGSSFVKKEYAVGNSIDAVTLTAPTSPTAYVGDTLTLKSGYGFECSFVDKMLVIDGDENTAIISCVAPQYFYALLPEYNYTFETDKCRSFEIASGKKIFVNDTNMLRQHFTPIYYPDGEYNFKIVISDCWTPAGMITTSKTATVTINGNMYDDWYVGRK